jgi:hypothetical protein
MQQGVVDAPGYGCKRHLDGVASHGRDTDGGLMVGLVSVQPAVSRPAWMDALIRDSVRMNSGQVSCNTRPC